MSQLTEKTKHPCWATFPCFYKKNDVCTYWIQVEVIMGKFAEDDSENRNCYRSIINTDHEPCLELSVEERKHGIENLFKL